MDNGGDAGSDSTAAQATKPPKSATVKLRGSKLVPADVDLRRAHERGKLTPKAQYQELYERHLKKCDEDILQLRADNKQLSDDLDRLRPEHAALQEAMRNLRANGTQAAVEIVIGGAAISAGTAFTNDIYKWIFVAGGFVCVLLGAISTIRTCWLALPPSQRM